MNPDPNRDYENEIVREYQDLAPLDLLHVYLFVLWLYVRERTRRAWLHLMWGKWADHLG